MSRKISPWDPGKWQKYRGQCAEAVLMVRPASFGYNPETAASNKFQQQPAAADGGDSAVALLEVDRMVKALAGEGLRVCLVDDTAEPPKPDAVFPNNWVSFHEDGTVVLYPMQAESRRRERRQEVIDAVVERLGRKVAQVVDLAFYEKRGKYLEGTGSLVLDHIEKTAYACISPRTHPDVVREWAFQMRYEPIIFNAVDRAGVPLYHTNVLMCICERVVVVGSEAIVEADRGRVLERLRATGRKIVEISQEEVARFGGNMLELGTWDESMGDYRVLVMSETARNALSKDAISQLQSCTDELLAVPIPTIERLGGGSVRCMLAEVFLPS